MAKVEYEGVEYESLADVPIRAMGRIKEAMRQYPTRSPNVARKSFDDLLFLTYGGVTLPPAEETYRSARTTALTIAEMVRDPAFPKPLIVADIGTGSGIIAVTIAQSLPVETQGENPQVKIVATDISGRALEVAQMNAMINGTPQVAFRKRDALEGLAAEFGKLDVIISNPPFSPTNGIHERFLKSSFIPLLALDGGLDSLDMYRKLFEQGRHALSDRGFIFVEHMFFRQPEVAALTRDYLPGAAILAIRGSVYGYRATAVGNHDTLKILQHYSGGKFV